MVGRLGQSYKWEWEGLQLQGTGLAAELTCEEESLEPKFYIHRSLGEGTSIKAQEGSIRWAGHGDLSSS